MTQDNTLKWVTAASVGDDYKIELTFNDGCVRVCDCKPLIDSNKFFAPLADKSVFDRFSLDGWTVCWLNGTIDIAPEYLYENGVEK